ncbi:hypothetical protein V7S43_000866 [Phytophthora oleae]|uniref:RxLR effector protein n=1 Tax=Phytophthora oleae TaxID=2107226 RepID=A0ABD3G6Y9_9STRA
MRFAFVVLATAAAFLASTDSALASEQTKLASVVAAGNPLLTRSLTAEQDAQRLLRATSNEESSFMEKTKFYYWYAMGRTPSYVYQDFFKGMDRSIIVNNPNYKVWERYKAYYDKKKAK